MSDQTIKCPNCRMEFPLSEALSNRIKEGLRAEYEERALKKDLEVGKREEELKKRLTELDAARKSVEDTVASRLSAEKAKLVEEARKRALERFEAELKDMKEEQARKDELLDDARKRELELRKKARELEEEKKALDIEVARKIDSERDKIRQSALEMFSDEHRLKDLEKDKKISDMLKTIEELKRKGEQGSMQAQGEVLELDLEALLKSLFPVDIIEPVPKGIRGADIIQRVYTRTGQHCGSIVWESKRTKAWNDDWITKLKDDQRDIKAEVAVLVTETLPRGVASFAQMEGVWVTMVGLAGGLAGVLRAGLIQLSLARLSSVGKNEKMEAVYAYLSGQGFRQRVEGIVESFRELKEELEAEKRAMTKIWARRERQLERAVTNTAGMYGDMQGIIGSTLPELKSLELGSGDEEE